MRTEDLTRTTRVLLVRHGLPGGHLVEDPGLSDVGHAQAHRLAEWVAAAPEPPVAVTSSDHRRAVETAEAIAQRLGLPLRRDPALREWVSGRTHYVLPEMLGENPRGIALQEGRFAEFVPQHDSEQLRADMVGAMRRLGAEHPGRTVVAVSHGGAINNLLGHVVGTRELFIVNPGYTSVSQLDVMSSGRLVLVSINETGHLLGRRDEEPAAEDVA